MKEKSLSRSTALAPEAEETAEEVSIERVKSYDRSNHNSLAPYAR